jgi:hypothetical protein
MIAEPNRNRRASASLSPVLVHFREPYGMFHQKLLILDQLLGSIPPIIVPKRQTWSARRRRSGSTPSVAPERNSTVHR